MIKNVSTSEMVLDINHLQFTDEVDVFGLNVEILNRITALNKLNKLCENIESPFRAKTDILFKVIDAILKGIEFTDLELMEYFKTRHEIEKFESVTYRVLDFSEFEMPVLAEFIIFGLSHERYMNMNELEKEALHTSYFDLIGEIDSNEIEMDLFLTKVKGLMSKYK